MKHIFSVVLALLMVSIGSLSAQTSTTKRFNNGVVSFAYPSNYTISTKREGDWTVVTGNQIVSNAANKGNLFEFRYIKIPQGNNPSPAEVTEALLAILEPEHDLFAYTFGDHNVTPIQPFSEDAHNGYAFTYIAEDNEDAAIGLEFVEVFQRTVLKVSLWVEDSACYSS